MSYCPPSCVYYPLSSRCPSWCNEYQKTKKSKIEVCKNKECSHQLKEDGFCSNPDCFYHKHEQRQECPMFKDWRIK